VPCEHTGLFRIMSEERRITPWLNNRRHLVDIPKIIFSHNADIGKKTIFEWTVSRVT